MMAVPVHDDHPEEVRTKFVADPEHARSILEREFPEGHDAVDRIAGGQPRLVPRIALIVGTVLLMIAAFVGGYLVRGSDTYTTTKTTPAVVAPMTPVSPDAIDRPTGTESRTPVSPDAVDRPPVISADMFGSPDAAEHSLSG